MEGPRGAVLWHTCGAAGLSRGSRCHCGESGLYQHHLPRMRIRRAATATQANVSVLALRPYAKRRLRGGSQCVSSGYVCVLYVSSWFSQSLPRWGQSRVSFKVSKSLKDFFEKKHL